MRFKIIIYDCQEHTKFDFCVSHITEHHFILISDMVALFDWLFLCVSRRELNVANVFAIIADVWRIMYNDSI